jgi:SAM-dependent methyltransferase
VCVNTIEHVASFGDLMGEFNRVLKPRGKIILTTYDTDFIFHPILYDDTHIYEWGTSEFQKFVSKFFVVEKTFHSGSFFNFFPLNFVIEFFLKPEICIVGRKSL